MAEQWARPFRVFHLDSGHEMDIYHGVRFPSGRCVIDDPVRGGVDVADSFEDLRLPADAEVEWADGGEA